MGHTIPVFFFPILQENIPVNLKTWHDAEHLLGEKAEYSPHDPYWISSSRNWWHQDATQKFCQKLGIPGLEFILEEIAVLDETDLQAAAKALNALLTYMSGGNLDIGPIDPRDGTLLGFYRDLVDETVEITRDQIRLAYEEAKETNEVDEGSARGHKSLVGYFSFLKSLRQGVITAIEKGQYLLYVMPQP